MSTSSAGPSSGRERHGYHFAVPSGWLNDPHGLCWHDHPDGPRYELFFQYNPDAPEWAVACRWGRTWSPDLVRWGPVDVALAPQPGEAGCWTGSVVVADDGTPVIAYTSVRADDLDRGAVVLATGDPAWRRFTADPSAPVVAGPPEGVTAFRDPHVEREEGGWRMVVGGGTADGRGLALLYRSADLRTWRHEGVLAERPAADRDPVGAGSVWECVQFFPLAGRWVLLVSAWEDGAPQRVVAAVGDRDGHRFAARRWQRFGATDVPYATTAFLDAEGRRCAVSWAREAGPVEGGWAGALTVPWVLGLRGDHLVQHPHPDVATLRTGRLAVLDGMGETGPHAPHLDLEVGCGPAAGGGRLLLRTADGRVLALEVPAGGGPVSVVAEGGPPVRLGTGAGGAAEPRLPLVRLLVDAGLVEVGTAAGEAAVVRLGWRGPLTLVVEGDLRVVVHGMPHGGR